MASSGSVRSIPQHGDCEAEQDIVWLDEEPPLSIYIECLTRCMTSNGIVMATFTPLLGLSDVVLTFMPGGKIPEDQIPVEVPLAA
jgi:phage terminase large subunit-like protein